MRRPAVLGRHDLTFPSPENALKEPNGLLAIGGDLRPERLLSAYSAGVFPWFNDDHGPILWWSPDPRAVFIPTQIKIARSLRRRLARNESRVTLDVAFDEVVAGCAAPR